MQSELERKVFELLTHGYPAPFARVADLSKRIAELFGQYPAALSDQERAVEVKVKPLEWGGDGDCYAFADVTHQSYSIVFEEGKFWSNWDMSLPPFGTIEAAKTAAQADYEQRIRSALVDVPVKPVAHLRPCGLTYISGEKRDGLVVADRNHPKAFPVYASPPIPHREGEDSAEVVKTGERFLKACDAYVDGGDIPDDALMCEYGDALEAFRAALAATRSGSASTAKGGQP